MSEFKPILSGRLAGPITVLKEDDVFTLEEDESSKEYIPGNYKITLGSIVTVCPTHNFQHREDVECRYCVEEDEFYEELARKATK